MRSTAAVLLLVFLAAGLVSCGSTTVQTTLPTETVGSTSQPPFPTTSMNEYPHTSVSEDEQAVYAAFVDDSDGKTVVVREDTLGDTLPQSEEEARHYILAGLPSVSDDTLEHYLYVNADSVSLPPDMKLGASYVLISTPEFVEVTSDPGWREIWRERFPDSEVACLSFSRIGFNESRTQALVYVRRLWVDGGYWLLELDDQSGTWKIMDSFSNVIVN